MKKSFTPVSTTTRSSRTGFFYGKLRQLGCRPSVPGREKLNPKSKGKEPCGVIWPNGEFGVSYHSKLQEVEAEPKEQYVPNGYTAATIRHEVLRPRYSPWPEGCAAWPETPWLVKSPKSAQRPETYGRKGITGYGQKTVRSGAHLLQEKYTKDRLSFLTLTVPSYGFEDEARIAAKWGYLTKSLLQALRRKLSRQGLPSSIVVVTELQPKRLQGREPGCLHLHLVFVGRHASGGWVFSPQELRWLWLRLLSNALGHTVPDAPCENVERVKHDASEYLSKYMSKGVASVTDLADIVGWERVPRQWWSATASVKAAVKKYTLRGPFSSSMLNELIEMWQREGYQDNTAGLKFCRPITIQLTKYQDYVIGFFGRLTPDTYRDLYDLTAMLKSA